MSPPACSVGFRAPFALPAYGRISVLQSCASRWQHARPKATAALFLFAKIRTCVPLRAQQPTRLAAREQASESSRALRASGGARARIIAARSTRLHSVGPANSEIDFVARHRARLGSVLGSRCSDQRPRMHRAQGPRRRGATSARAASRQPREYRVSQLLFGTRSDFTAQTHRYSAPHSIQSVIGGVPPRDRK